MSAAAGGLLAAAFLYASHASALPRRWFPAACRAGSVALLLLLIFDRSGPAPGGPPLVLLDASLSLEAAGGRSAEARALAASLGEVRAFGDPQSSDSAGFARSELLGALRTALATGRPVTVITDGELDDGALVSPTITDGVQVRVLPRRPVPSALVRGVQATPRVLLDDTVRVESTIGSEGALHGAVLRVSLTEGARTLARDSLTSGGLVGFRVPASRLGVGEHLLRVQVSAAGDGEPRDDARLAFVSVQAQPAVVLVASPPDWESRFLLEALGAVSGLPVRGFVAIMPGQWRAVPAMRPVTESEVRRIAAGAQLLIRMGLPDLPARAGAATWDWPAPATGREGDWYLSPDLDSPLGESLAGISPDSLPPALRLLEAGPLRDDEKAVLRGRLGRRGEAVVAASAHRDNGHHLVMRVHGLWRWAFRGGGPGEAYRTFVGSSVSWLLDDAQGETGVALEQAVVPRGEAFRFRWRGAGTPPAAVTLQGAGARREVALVFDAAGLASVRASPGAWRWRSGADSGLAAVEEFSAEWIPRPATIGARETAAIAAARPPLRNVAWPWVLLGLLLSGEWWYRRRHGAR